MKAQMIVAAMLLCVALVPMAAPDAAPLQPLMTGWERYFRLDWSAATHQGRPVVYGHVRNEWGATAMNVRLLVEGIDDQGRIASQTIGWLGTQLTPGTTAAFEVPVNAGAPQYRVSVFAFDWVQRGRGLN
jgi:hypothetical protein